jgi:hypothetical protein
MAMLAVGGVSVAVAAPAAAQEPAATRAAGTVKETSATGLTLTTTAGQQVSVTVPTTAQVLVVPPGSHDLKSATKGTLADVAAGDRALVSGTAGDSAGSITALRVILMKASAIASVHAEEEAAWQHGVGGIVKSVDAAAGKIMVASGMKMVAVTVTPSTIIRRYAGGSVSFGDAKVSTIGAIHPGDQIRTRGTKSADGLSLTADELVTGSFHNYSGLIASIDTAAGTITLKDLATKKTVTVAVSSSSDVRRLPPMLAMRIAAQMKGGGAAAAGGAQGSRPAGAPEAYAGSDAQRAGRAGMDLSAMLSRLPTETLAGLKVGEAVMIVSSSSEGDPNQSTAVTLLTGVDPILTATPNGQSTTLSPWSLGGDMGGADAGGGAGPQ